MCRPTRVQCAPSVAPVFAVPVASCLLEGSMCRRFKLSTGLPNQAATTDQKQVYELDVGERAPPRAPPTWSWLVQPPLRQTPSLLPRPQAAHTTRAPHQAIRWSPSLTAFPCQRRTLPQGRGIVARTAILRKGHSSSSQHAGKGCRGTEPHLCRAEQLASAKYAAYRSQARGIVFDHQPLKDELAGREV